MLVSPRSMASTLYLHWTATGYDWIRPGHYHSIVAGDGRVHRLHSYDVDLPAHTWRRNSDSVAIACACMGGRPDPWSLPPTPEQLDSLCREAADVARRFGWTAEMITVERLMTHAEAAANRDGRPMHDNYGPVIWGGTGERWDLMQLQPGGSTDGGDRLRQRIRALLEQPDPAPSPERLAFAGDTLIQVRGADFRVQIDAEGRSWAPVVTLLQRYELPHAWDADHRRLLIQALDVAPTYRDDAVQASIGWPLMELTLEREMTPVILTGIIRPSPQGDQAWCRVLEFAEEFGISVEFSPFRLGERRGG